MSWKRVREILEDVITIMDKPSVGSEWLNRLEKTECKDAYRLGFCIAIDVAGGAIPREDYADILNGIDNKETCPRRAFARAFAAHPRRKDLICASRLRRLTRSDDESYIRVLSLLDFITYYKKDRSLAPDDVAAVRAPSVST